MYVCIYALSKKRINSINFLDLTQIVRFCASLCVFEKFSFLSYV